LTAFSDTHCHLYFNSFENDLAEVIQRSKDAGITRILIPGTDLDTSRQAVALAEKHPGFWAAVGVHPNDATSWDASTLAELAGLAEHPRVVAVGEIGLDYYREFAAPALQRSILEEQLDLSARLRKPVILHSREAMPELLPLIHAWYVQLVNENNPLAARPGVFHAFDGDLETARQIIQMNFLLGVGGPLTFRNANPRRELVASLPLSSLLLETDAPYLAPQPHRGQRNEPAFIPLIANQIAELHVLPVDEIARITQINANRLFAWDNND